MITPLPYTFILGISLCLLSPFFGPGAQAQSAIEERSPVSPDSLAAGRPRHYFSLTLGTGADMQFCTNSRGLLSISIPYQATDASGNTTNTLFSSQPKRVYTPLRFYVVPIGFEVGGMKSFISVFAAASVVGGSITGGYPLTIGYGLNWYVNCSKRHYSDKAKKAFVVKTSMNLFYSWERGSDLSSVLGRIDNTGRNIHLLGFDADSTWVQAPDRYNSGGTHYAKNLDLAYAQRAFALLPKIAFATNPYLHGTRFQLELGYFIPLAQSGRLFIQQDDGSYSAHYHQHFIGGPVKLDNPGFSIAYNGKVTRSAPYALGGPYLSFTIMIGSGPKRDKRV